MPETTLRPRASKEPQGFRQDPRSPATVYLSGPDNRKFRSSQGVRPCVLPSFQQVFRPGEPRGAVRIRQAALVVNHRRDGRSLVAVAFSPSRVAAAHSSTGGEKSKSSSSFRRSRLHPRLLRRMRSAAPANCVCQAKTAGCRVSREDSSSSFRRPRLHPRLLRRMRSAAPANCVCQAKTAGCRVSRKDSSSSFRRSPAPRFAAWPRVFNLWNPCLGHGQVKNLPPRGRTKT